MRIHLKVKSDGQPVPFNHQQKLTGTIHKWLGENREHGSVSLHSFSWLTGGKNKEGMLYFESGSNFFISAHEPHIIKRIIEGIKLEPQMFDGLKVEEIIIQENPDFTNITHFQTASPILIKRREGEKINHILYDDPNAGEYLKETLLTKMEKVGMDDPTMKISFDSSFPHPMRKNVRYNNLHNICSWCPVIIEGKPETKLFAWNVGLGNSTGIGLGAIQ